MQVQHAGWYYGIVAACKTFEAAERHGLCPMKHKLLRFVLPLIPAAAFAAGADVHDHLGLQLYSLRETAKESEIKVLDLTKSYGFTEIEAGKPVKVPLDEYAAAIKERGLKVIGIHAGYDVLQNDIADAIHTAKVLGAHYITCPWVKPAKGEFTEEYAREVAANFNKFGEAIKAAGLQFAYHPHGYEFVPSKSGNGTNFDLLMRETKPGLVEMEMDVFWVFHGGQDPVKLLEKYSDRWTLMHVKDMRKGASTGFTTAHAAPTDNVAVGAGQIDWPAVLSTAKKVGVKYYFIEDETPAPLENIPASLKYLHGLKR